MVVSTGPTVSVIFVSGNKKSEHQRTYQGSLSESMARLLVAAERIRQISRGPRANRAWWEASVKSETLGCGSQRRKAGMV